MNTKIYSVTSDDDVIQAFPPRPAAVIERRFNVGATCTAVMVRGEFAGFIWLKRTRYEEDEVRCSFVLVAPALSVWDFDVYIEPKYRMSRTMARLWSHVDGELATKGVQWSFSRISAFNPASLRSHARLGAVSRGSTLFLILGPVQLSLLPDFPHVYVSVCDRHTPVVYLRPPA